MFVFPRCGRKNPTVTALKKISREKKNSGKRDAGLFCPNIDFSRLALRNRSLPREKRKTRRRESADLYKRRYTYAGKRLMNRKTGGMPPTSTRDGGRKKFPTYAISPKWPGAGRRREYGKEGSVRSGKKILLLPISQHAWRKKSVDKGGRWRKDNRIGRRRSNGFLSDSI